MDVLWYYTANMKTAGSNARRFKLLSKIAEVVLIIPHSNAELERLFSLVKKKKILRTLIYETRWEVIYYSGYENKVS